MASASGSGLSALATSPERLIGARAVMGIGGAFIMPSTLSIIMAVFPAHERPKAIGVWAGVSGLGTGSLRGDYEGMAVRVVSAAHRSGAATLMPRLLGDIANDPELRAIFYENLVDPRRAQMRAILERAVARGEIRADVDVELMIYRFAGPVVYRLLITGGDYAQRHTVDEQFDVLLNGLAPH